MFLLFTDDSINGENSLQNICEENNLYVRSGYTAVVSWSSSSSELKWTAVRFLSTSRKSSWNSDRTSISHRVMIIK